MTNSTDIVGGIGVSFANAIVSGDFEAAHALLSEPLKGEWPPARLEAELAAMIDYGVRPAEDVELVSVNNMMGWEVRQPADVGWAYVGISGEGFTEAVSVIVASEDGRYAIREIEWGRP